MAVKVLVTGAAGQIAYSLTYMICRGYMFGSDTHVILHLLDIEPMKEKMNGLLMELEDCCFPLLDKVVVTTDLKEAFEEIDVACMVGAMPRGPGMERKDLLAANVKIFRAQGAALDAYAKTDVKVVVVGNPANTNAYVMSLHAPNIPKENFSALTRLDMNRATGQISKMSKVSCDKVKNCIIWGNHSSTQFADVSHAVVITDDGMKPVKEIISNDNWIKNDFLQMIQTRGADVIKARGLSSAMSAAKAIVNHVHDWWCGTPDGVHVSMAVISNGEYGAPRDVMYSFPVTIKNKKWSIVKELQIDEWAKGKMAVTGEELLKEREVALSIIEGKN